MGQLRVRAHKGAASGGRQVRLARRGVAEIKVYHPRILPGPVFTGGFESVGHPRGLAARGGTVERHVGGGHCPERQRHRFGAHTEAGGQELQPGIELLQRRAGDLPGGARSGGDQGRPRAGEGQHRGGFLVGPAPGRRQRYQRHWKVWASVGWVGGLRSVVKES